MLEELLRGAFYHKCRDCEEMTPLVSLKGKPWKKENIFRDFFNVFSANSHFDGELLKHVLRHQDGLLASCWRIVSKNADCVVDGYIASKYGTMKNAMITARTFETLFDGFEHDFAERRMLIMKEMSKKTAELALSKSVPHSHGGVANLLKILTKTMEKQGTSIRTVAKVQYSVCMQAGIFIPEEFLTDILVAANMADGEAAVE